MPGKSHSFLLQNAQVELNSPDDSADQGTRIYPHVPTYNSTLFSIKMMIIKGSGLKEAIWGLEGVLPIVAGGMQVEHGTVTRCGAGPEIPQIRTTELLFQVFGRRRFPAPNEGLSNKRGEKPKEFVNYHQKAGAGKSEAVEGGGGLGESGKRIPHGSGGFGVASAVKPRSGTPGTLWKGGRGLRRDLRVGDKPRSEHTGKNIVNMEKHRKHGKKS